MDFFGITNIGLVRKINQDSFAVKKLFDSSVLAIVCDGMGGPSGGEVASQLTCNLLTSLISSNYDANTTESELSVILRVAIEQANKEVFLLSKKEEAYSGMGTTAALALIKKDSIICANVGDSRIYLYSNGTLTQITKDHSVVQEMLDGGNITSSEARVHPKRHIITRAVGTLETVEIDFFKVNRPKNATLLLCSDGLSNMADDPIIATEISTSSSAEGMASSLLKKAIDAGATDNVTAIVISL